MPTAARRLLLLFVVALVAAGAPTPAGAHDEHEFEPLSEILATARPSARMLFFALADDFETASPYTLVPATGRPLAWVADGTQLPEGTTAVAPLRAIGLPPRDPANARYLVPVLDLARASLRFAPRRLETGRLVAGAPATGANVVPITVGPQQSVTTTSEEPGLDPPVEVDAAQLTALAPALFVRRASPSRVVFGVRLASGDYVPLIDEHGIAFTARRNGHPGLAIAIRPGVATPSDGGSRRGLVVLFGVLDVVAAVVGFLFLRRRRLSRRGGR